MPSMTFLNLKEEKRQRIIDAAINEFANELYVNASINRIIKACEVPRGSFYMYFNDKEDLYFYLLENYNREYINKFTELIKENHGDVLIAFQKLFIYTTDEVLVNDNGFFKNFLLNMNYLMENKITCIDKKDMRVEALKYINSELFNIKEEKDIYYVFNILMIIFIHKLIETIRFPEHKEKISNSYIRELELLGAGFYKEVNYESI
jgi:Transcriptional regulator